MDRPVDPYGPLRPTDYVAAAALMSAAAGLIHAWVIDDHLRDGAPVVTFFVVVAVAQIWWAWAVMRRATRPLLVIGLMLCVTVVAIWAVSRTIGLQLVEKEPVGTADLIATLLEIGIIVAIARCWTAPPRKRIDPRSAHPLLYFLVAAVAVTTLYALVLDHSTR